jgi:hypothetical protein
MDIPKHEGIENVVGREPARLHQRGVAWRVDRGGAPYEPLGGCRGDVRVHPGSRRGRDPGFSQPRDRLR